jgi:hypothetical protein
LTTTDGGLFLRPLHQARFAVTNLSPVAVGPVPAASINGRRVNIGSFRRDVNEEIAQA